MDWNYVVRLTMMIVLGALVYRLRGSKNSPRPLWQIVFAFPYSVVALQAEASLYVGVLVWMFTAGMVATGHAAYIDVGTVKPGAANSPADGRRDEWYGDWIPGSGVWHDLAGLMVNGMLIVGACALVLAVQGYVFAAWVLLASAVFKPISYFLAHHVYMGSWDRTAMGEILTGGAFMGSLFFVSSMAKGF